MDANTQLIHVFYDAFKRGDYKTMQECYHRDAVFSDPAFPELNSIEVQAMWQMLITASRDLIITFDDVVAMGDRGSCRWEAQYTFTKTGRKVHNRIQASFQFQDGKIIRHVDQFNFWKWSTMALGLPGYILGWTPLLKRKVRKMASDRLRYFLSAR